MTPTNPFKDLRGSPNSETDFALEDTVPYYLLSLSLSKDSLLTSAECSLNLLASLNDNGERNLERLYDAVQFATEKHQGQLRKDGKTEYVYHLFRLLTLYRYFLRDLTPFFDSEELIDGAIVLLLHDTVEDCEVKYDEIANRFGDNVSEGVFWLTEESKTRSNRRIRKELAARKIGYAPALFQFLKLLDVADNVFCCCKDFFDLFFFKLFHEEKLNLLNHVESGSWSHHKFSVDLITYLKNLCTTRLNGV